MTVSLFSSNLTYVSVPKCACTSLKAYFYEVQHAQAFDDQTSARSIHQIYRSRSFSKLPHDTIANHQKLTVVRDPVRRFVSGYYGKVVREKCLTGMGAKAALRVMRLPVDPTIDLFMDNLARYRLASPVVRKHFQPLSYFLGTDPGWFSQIYDMSDLPAFTQRVAEQTGVPISLRHLNHNQDRPKAQSLSPETAARIRSLYDEDFALYGPFFKSAA